MHQEEEIETWVSVRGHLYLHNPNFRLLPYSVAENEHLRGEEVITIRYDVFKAVVVHVFGMFNPRRITYVFGVFWSGVSGTSVVYLKLSKGIGGYVAK